MSKKKCPECGSRLIKGKFYYHCSGDDCDHWEFMEPERYIAEINNREDN